MVLDELKLISNDATYTPEHLIFLADNYRALLLDRRYRDARKGEVTRSNYQEICLDLIEVPAIPGTSCAGVYLRSTKKMPSVMNIGIRHIYPVDYFTSEHISYIPLERMPYVGNNKWLSNIIYATRRIVKEYVRFYIPVLGNFGPVSFTLILLFFSFTANSVFFSSLYISGSSSELITFTVVSSLSSNSTFISLLYN